MTGCSSLLLEAGSAVKSMAGRKEWIFTTFAHFYCRGISDYFPQKACFPQSATHSSSYPTAQ